jgi:hypothetical protein
MALWNASLRSASEKCLLKTAWCRFAGSCSARSIAAVLSSACSSTLEMLRTAESEKLPSPFSSGSRPRLMLPLSCAVVDLCQMGGKIGARCGFQGRPRRRRCGWIQDSSFDVCGDRNQSLLIFHTKNLRTLPVARVRPRPAWCPASQIESLISSVAAAALDTVARLLLPCGLR